MLILGLDTGTDICSVSLFDEAEVLYTIDSQRDFSHASLINVYIQRCLDECGFKIAQLDAIAIASGPGSYTGLRVGASTAKGLCYGADLPLIAIDSITALAHGATYTYDVQKVIPMIDARREEVYTAVFDNTYSMMTPISKVVVNQAFFDEHKDTPYLLCGNGVEKFIGRFTMENATILHSDTSAAFLHRPATIKYSSNQFEALDTYSPFYLNDPNITTAKS
jgi:tRNA threonylcarbamoyladenosine biosynthesis protein TsaB